MRPTWEAIAAGRYRGSVMSTVMVVMAPIMTVMTVVRYHTDDGRRKNVMTAMMPMMVMEPMMLVMLHL